MERLILFDIDGTMVRGGPAKQAFELAMGRVFGTAGEIDGHDFSGKTDPQIARELLQEAGRTERSIQEGLPALWEVYLRELEERLPERPMTVLPGVRRLLEALEGMEEVALGLVTGNIREGARLKLGSVGLMDHFPLGGFGSDSEVREDLPGIAMERAFGRWGVRFPPEAVVVVGDTPRDVACGQHAGTRAVAVATGRFGVERLAGSGADRVLESFGDVGAAMGALLGS